MDQLKDILKQAIHHRFWIAVGISFLLPATAYFLGASAIQQQAVAGADTIDKAYKAVKAYASGKLVNKQYAEIVSTKTEDLTKDVDDSWKKLYDRQLPLLTWPESVQERFNAWGRQWPKDTDASAVQLAIIAYVEAYPKFVSGVYSSFHPFDPATGTGIVAAPPEAALLRPATFSESSPPGLGKVWSAQERLWIQGTLLDVVAKVNKDAKSWDTAVIKQINSLEIGNTAAQDQRSIAKGEALEESPDITDPAAPPPAEAEATSSPGIPGGPGGPGSQSSSYGAGAGGGNTPAQNAESVYYIKSESDAIKILPVQMTVLIDQDHIQDFLVALENSPMTIQVRDFELYKPLARVTKPEKGAQMAFGMGTGMGMGGMGSAASMYSPAMMTGYGGRMSSPEMSSSASMYNTMGGGSAAVEKKGVDARGKTREKDAAEQRAKAKSGKVTSLHDPYYNIVEVKVYGQARFFNPPPPPPSAPPSQSDSPAEAAAPADKKAEDPKAEADKKAEPAKGEDVKAEPKKKGEDAKDADKPKGEPAKAEPAKDAAEKKAVPAKDAAEKKAEPAKDADKAKADEKTATPAKGEAGAASPPR